MAGDTPRLSLRLRRYGRGTLDKKQRNKDGGDRGSDDNCPPGAPVSHVRSLLQFGDPVLNGGPERGNHNRSTAGFQLLCKDFSKEFLSGRSKRTRSPERPFSGVPDRALAHFGVLEG